MKYIKPHILLFISYNLLYFLPLYFAFKFKYSEGGIAGRLSISNDLFSDVFLIYLIAVIFFIIGHIIVELIFHKKSIIKFQLSYGKLNIKGGGLLFTFLIVIFYLFTKALLIPKGVYKNYAFDSGNMVGGVWSTSMFFSESLLLMILVVMLSRLRFKKFVLILLTLSLALNVLHGTRIFLFILIILLGCFYIYDERYSLKRKLFTIIFLSMGGVVFFYLIFLMRSGILFDSYSFQLYKIISPIIYESVFNQISLFNAVKLYQEGLYFNGHRLIFDIISFTIPRFLLPYKGEINLMNEFSGISPLGGMSGYAAGLLYFSHYFFIFYLFLGFVLNCFEKISRGKNMRIYRVLYIYFCCDILFRLMRDGYLIPIKMFINGAFLVLIVFSIHRLLVLFVNKKIEE